MFPATKLSRFTAAHSSVAPACCVPTPPATARLGLAAANSRDALDLVGRHAGSCAAGRRELGERPGPRRRARVRGRDHVGGRRGRALFGAGANRQPLVRVERGEIPARTGIDELGHVTVGESVGLGEAALVLGGREPGLQEVRAEGEYVLRLAEIVRR
jgi:hypothetical protein